MSTIASIIAANSGSLIIIFFLLIVALAWLTATWKVKMESRAERADQRLDETNARLDETNVRLDKVYDAVVGKSFSFVEDRSSPRRLNDYGKALADKINAKEIADRYVTRMCKESKGMNSYQVQQHCFRFCMDGLLEDLEKNDKARFNEIADVAYQDGILIDYLTRVIGLILRDQVLAMSGKQPTAGKHSPASKPERGLAA